MTERLDGRPGCAQLREVAPDVALGLLTGEERAAALAHLESCEACRAEVAGLAVTADEVLLAAPEATPPAGFADGVLARLAAKRADDEVVPAAVRVPHRRRRRVAVVALAAAAVALVVAGLVTVVRSDEPPAESVASTEMRTGRGQVVGEATVRGGGPVVVTVDVPEWAAMVERWDAPPGADYWLAVEARDGTRTVSPVPDAGEPGGWEVSVDAGPDEVATVSMLDDEGRVWCMGRFST